MHNEEIEVLKCLKRIRGDVFIDVGAYTGKYTKLLSRNFKLVIAIEPHPENFKKLCHRVGSITNVVPLNIAISNTIGLTRLFLSKDPQQHSLIPDSEVEIEDFKKNRVGSFILVRTFTIESIFRSFNLSRVDLIKVDTEGCERQVLDGSLEVIDRIDRWMIETHSSRDELYIPRFLREFGYEVEFIPPYHIYAWRSSVSKDSN